VFPAARFRPAKVSRFVELLGLAAGGRGGTGRGTAAAR